MKQVAEKPHFRIFVTFVSCVCVCLSHLKKKKKKRQRSEGDCGSSGTDGRGVHLSEKLCLADRPNEASNNAVSHKNRSVAGLNQPVVMHLGFTC